MISPRWGFVIFYAPTPELRSRLMISAPLVLCFLIFSFGVDINRRIRFVLSPAGGAVGWIGGIIDFAPLGLRNFLRPNPRASLRADDLRTVGALSFDFFVRCGYQSEN